MGRRLKRKVKKFSSDTKTYQFRPRNDLSLNNRRASSTISNSIFHYSLRDFSPIPSDVEEDIVDDVIFTSYQDLRHLEVHSPNSSLVASDENSSLSYLIFQNCSNKSVSSKRKSYNYIGRKQMVVRKKTDKKRIPVYKKKSHPIISKNSIGITLNSKLECKSNSTQSNHDDIRVDGDLVSPVFKDISIANKSYDLSELKSGSKTLMISSEKIQNNKKKPHPFSISSLLGNVLGKTALSSSVVPSAETIQSANILNASNTDHLDASYSNFTFNSDNSNIYSTIHPIISPSDVLTKQTDPYIVPTTPTPTNRSQPLKSGKNSTFMNDSSYHRNCKRGFSSQNSLIYHPFKLFHISDMCSNRHNELIIPNTPLSINSFMTDSIISPQNRNYKICMNHIFIAWSIYARETHLKEEDSREKGLCPLALHSRNRISSIRAVLRPKPNRMKESSISQNKSIADIYLKNSIGNCTVANTSLPVFPSDLRRRNFSNSNKINISDVNYNKNRNKNQLIPRNISSVNLFNQFSSVFKEPIFIVQDLSDNFPYKDALCCNPNVSTKYQYMSDMPKVRLQSLSLQPRGDSQIRDAYNHSTHFPISMNTNKTT